MENKTVRARGCEEQANSEEKGLVHFLRFYYREARLPEAANWGHRRGRGHALLSMRSSVDDYSN